MHFILLTSIEGTLSVVLPLRFGLPTLLVDRVHHVESSDLDSCALHLRDARFREYKSWDATSLLVTESY